MAEVFRVSTAHRGHAGAGLVIVLLALLVSGCAGSMNRDELRQATPMPDHSPFTVTQTQDQILTRKPEYVADELLVKFRRGTPASRIEVINRELQGGLVRILGDGQLYQLRFPSGTNLELCRQEYERLPEVEYAEPNYRVKAQ
jgi:hypothetical protein